MTYPAIHAQLKIAEEFARHIRSYLAAALDLTQSTPCPPSHIAAIEKACGYAQTLSLHVGNVAPLFNQPAEPPRD